MLRPTSIPTLSTSAYDGPAFIATLYITRTYFSNLYIHPSRPTSHFLTYIRPKPLGAAYTGRKRDTIESLASEESALSVVSCVRILAGSPSGQTGAVTRARAGWALLPTSRRSHSQPRLRPPPPSRPPHAPFRGQSWLHIAA